MSTALNWESTYTIALSLHRQYPAINLEKVTLTQIYEWTVNLPGFEDDPSLCNDDILKAIFQEWYEETIHER
jgi:FeS assembly protein IscX